MNLDLIDTELQQISDVFDDTNKFIEKCISNDEKYLFTVFVEYQGV